MPKTKRTHGMTGQINASKGREHWERTTISLDPKLKKLAKKAGINLTDFVDQALRDRFGK